ncbi:MAG: hypothetical protein EA379_09755 [Phycisphaerales bacterium]|nr:MAG: hypothetical protein EA379_09755 [Phycisphaerales bacterium]
MPPFIKHDDDEQRDPLPNSPPGNALLGVVLAPIGVAMLGAGIHIWTDGDPAYRSPEMAIFFALLGVVCLLGSVAFIGTALARGDSRPGASAHDPFKTDDDPPPPRDPPRDQER